MGSDPVIRTSNLGKRYRIGERAPYRTLRDAIAHAFVPGSRKTGLPPAGIGIARPTPGKDGHIWALRNVSFEIQPGEAVGIIGPNGAGKSTLLKVLSRITEPTEGWAEIRGRLSSLLEVGTGFHPELTGRENVFLNGAILGMTRAEIERKFDDIVKFAEVEKFIDTPVKWYSDGMRVRLGFAVAAHLEPEILLVDEVLAVGDLAFQRKSMGKMKDVTGEGRTVLLVSHNMASIQNLCNVAYLLDHGTIASSGDPGDVIGRYLESVNRVQPVKLAGRTDRRGNGRLRISELSMTATSDHQEVVQCGAPVSFRLSYEGTAPLRNVQVYLYIYNQSGEVVFSVGNSVVGKIFDELPSRGTFVCRFEKLPLLPGAYYLHFVCWVNGVVADLLANAFSFHVIEGDFFGTGRLPQKNEGSVAVPHDWEVFH